MRSVSWRPIRVGLVGSGLMGTMHSEAYSRVAEAAGRGFALTRIASRNEATASDLASQYGYQAATTDWREVTRADDVDLVDVCLPEQAHAEVALDAIAHGKHVLCEKPLAPSATEALRMWRAATAAGVVHMTGFVLRQWPAYVRAKAILESGGIGRVRHVRAAFLSDAPTLLESSLRGLASHVLDAVMELCGPIQSVAAVNRWSEERSSVDAALSALFRLSSGSTGSLEVDREARGREIASSIVVEGATGGLAIGWNARDRVELFLDEPDGPARGPRRVELYDIGGPPIVLWPGSGFGAGDLFTAQARALSAAVSEGDSHHADFGAGYRVAAVSDAIVEAWGSESWVSVRNEEGSNQ